MNGSEIAIIGLAGKFPGAQDIKSFWNNLCEGKHGLKLFTEEEVKQITNKQLTSHKDYVPSAGGYLDGTSFFDHAFFGYSPREAQMMDPQMRIFHECVWTALEDAGYANPSYDGLISLFAGASANHGWVEKLKASGKFNDRDNMSITQLIDRDFLTTLISYSLNLKGPSFNIQTACSTSLVAVHQACQALLNGETDIAIAGGVSMAFGSENGYVFQEGSILSPDGFCRAFDEEAAGCIQGSGAGVVVLKLLEDAIAAQDNIYAVIKGSAINNDGNRKVGFTAPSILGQAEVIKQALEVAEVEPAEIGYVEAHGTGTKLGDPVEFEALKMVYGREPGEGCGIGSVKTSIGHLDVAAGAAGLIKATLALQHKKLPPSLNFQKPNPVLGIEKSPFYVVDSLKEWQGDQVKRAGLSSFGIGGTNSHVILEEFQKVATEPSHKKKHLLKFSAKTVNSLTTYMDEFKEFLSGTSSKIEDIAYTLDKGRKSFSYRNYLLCESVEDAMKQINEDFASGIAQSQRDHTVIFMFPGQGIQYAGMCGELYETETTFRDSLDNCFALYEQLTGKSLKEIWTDDVNEVISQTRYAQPLIFSIEYSLAQLLKHYGIMPNVMVGHSIGEYAAICYAGVLALEDTMRIVIKRADLMQQLPGGSMLSVPLSEEKASQYLSKEISLAAANHTKSSVLSGDSDAIKALQDTLNQSGIASIIIPTSHAFHSHMMEPVMEEFERFIASFEFHDTDMTLISSMTGTVMEADRYGNPAYWSEQLRNTVRFAEATAVTCAYEAATFIEVGPGNTLINFVRKHEGYSKKHHLIQTSPANAKTSGALHTFYSAIGKCWKNGTLTDLTNFYEGENRGKVSLPTYQFDKMDVSFSIDEQPTEKAAVPDVQSREKWFYSRSWEQVPEAPLQQPLSREAKWLVMIDQQELLDEVKHRLPEDQLVMVQSGDRFLEISPQHFIIDVDSSADYARLIQTLDLNAVQELNIIHGLSLKQDTNIGLTAQRTETLLQNGFFSIVNLVKNLGSKPEQVNLMMLTNNVFEVTGGELLFPENATIVSLAKIIPLEYLNIKTRLLDITSADFKRSKTVVSHILNYWGQKQDRITALRGKYRWAPTVKQVQNMDSGTQNLLQDDKVYLMIGFGGMASYIAQSIVDQVNSKVVIMHRSSLPSRDSWDTLDSETHSAQLIRKIDAIKNARNAHNIHFIQGDCTHLADVKDVVAKAEETLGEIAGVIHTAGVIDNGGVIHRRDKASLIKAMASKVHGSINLEQVFKEKGLDFMILFSSIGNELYDEKFGQSGYNAANEFMESYCYYESNVDRKITINWCDWKEVGMAVTALEENFAGNQSVMEAYENMSITPAQGQQIFHQICKSRLDNVLVSTVDLIERIKKREAVLEDYKAFVDAYVDQQDGDQLSDVVFESTGNLETDIANIWKDYLGYDSIGRSENIFELGASSLDVVQVNNLFKKHLNIDIPVTTLFEYSTIHELVQFLENEEEENTAQPEIEERISAGKNKLNRLKQLSKK